MFRRLAYLAVTILTTGIACADAPPVQADVRLSQGRLYGQAVNQAGRAHRAAEVRLYSVNGQLLGNTQTDARGVFVFRAIHPGVCLVSVRQGDMPQTRTLVRLWRASLAPPNAVDALLVTVGLAARGQAGWSAPEGPLRSRASSLANQLGGAGGVGVAVVGATIATVVIASESNSPGS